MRLRRDLRPCRPRLSVNVNLERVHGDVVGDADPLTYRRDSVGGTHDRHVTMKTTPLTVSWIFESRVGHGFRLVGRHPRLPHTTSDDPDDQRSVCTGGGGGTGRSVRATVWARNRGRLPRLA